VFPGADLLLPNDDRYGGMDMSDLRVDQSNAAAHSVDGVKPDGDAPRREDPGQQRREPDDSAGSEELAIALAAPSRGHTLVARYETDGEGNPLIRILDRERNETLALLTPEELQALTEDTGLPPGLLVRAVS